MNEVQPMEMDGDTTQYWKVIFKKREGSLILTAKQLTYQSLHNHDSENAVSLEIDWKDVVKHQVSPESYPKALLKIILVTKNSSSSSLTSLTFQMADRTDLERIRKDITYRLQTREALSNGSSAKKRPLEEVSRPSMRTSFGELDPTAVAVTRASLLASNAALRQQHKYLVQETGTITEDDFWTTHRHLLEEEYARIAGVEKSGTSSVLQSHLPHTGRVRLGVQEMRQIFILYPAVHKAYEEKVPLELSDEQFWRKYLESEYFHRDRGRIGSASRNYGIANKKSTGPSVEHQDARAAAVGTDDMFSRYDQKLQEKSMQEATTATTTDASRCKWGTHLAVGQFDLASTLATERGELLGGPKDNHPPNPNDDGKGARVIQKYNRHWAMVLHPEDAVAGANLMEVARKSVMDVLPDDTDPQALGGIDEEMRRLTSFADASEENANHAIGVGIQDREDYEPLTLKDIEVYYRGQLHDSQTKDSSEEAAKRHSIFSQRIAVKTQALVKKLATTPEDIGKLIDTCFPPPDLGLELLSALTKKMAKDSQTEEQSIEMVNKLPSDFRDRLQSYFRRSSELLRHFFGLRRLEKENSSANVSQKLARIVQGMETFYREMEVFRKELPQTEIGEMMRKMCLPIMDQLDWAFKEHREGSGGGGGGFVTVQ
jgi:transcription initiation factor TFIIH subunit 1